MCLVGLRYNSSSSEFSGLVSSLVEAKAFEKSLVGSREAVEFFLDS